MNAYASLSAKHRESPPRVGDFVTLEIMLEGKLNSTGPWSIKGAENGKWFSTGSLTLSLPSLKEVSADGPNTKLAIEGFVHQPGPLSHGSFVLVEGGSKTEATVASGALSVEAKAVAQEGEPPPPWTLPPVPFGGWNLLLLLLLAALAMAGFYLLYRKLGRKIAGRRKLNHKEEALSSLQTLQKFARNKKALQQEEWKKFGFELAGIIRKYSDKNFHLDSSDMTDREFLAELNLHPRAKAQVEALASILNRIDEVRYGRKDLDVTAVPGLLLETRKFVEQTFFQEEGGKK